MTIFWCADINGKAVLARLPIAGLAVWAEALPETKLTDEQVPLSY